MAFPQKLSQEKIRQLNEWTAYKSYMETWFWGKLIGCPARTIALFCGNRFGKTASIARYNVLSVAGYLPVAEKNFDFLVCNPENIWEGHRFSLLYAGKLNGMCPKCGKTLHLYCDPSRVVRCASENLPGQCDDGESKQSTETRNTQYPMLKRWLPPSLIKKDIRRANPVLWVKDPNKGPDIGFEFVSYNQSVQAQAGVPRKRLWYDEQPPLPFWEENRYRTMDTGGDEMWGLTPALHMSYAYDEIYCRARKYYRTKTIADLLKLPQEEDTGLHTSIAVFQAATDDNPTINMKFVEEKFAEVSDPDELMIRRYGVFRQVSGTIQKGFNLGVHVIGGKKFFPEGIPRKWTHARLIDYHQRVRWAIAWCVLSPDNELFAYMEYNPDPTNTTTYEIVREMIKNSGEYQYMFNLIDPLSATVQGNTCERTLDDINRYIREFKRDYNMGHWCEFSTWDTKGNKGREDLQLRIKNSVRVGKPFNNRIRENGREIVLPTFWVLDNCPLIAKSLKQWRWSERVRDDGTKEASESPEQRWSHFPMCLEGILKVDSFKPRRIRDDGESFFGEDRRKTYFSQRQAAGR